MNITHSINAANVPNPQNKNLAAIGAFSDENTITVPATSHININIVIAEPKIFSIILFLSFLHHTASADSLRARPLFLIVLSPIPYTQAELGSPPAFIQLRLTIRVRTSHSYRLSIGLLSYRMRRLHNQLDGRLLSFAYKLGFGTAGVM